MKKFVFVISVFIIMIYSNILPICASEQVVYTENDKRRLDAVIQFSDNVLKKGRDYYHGLPLFAEGIDIKTEEFIKWRFYTDESKTNIRTSVVSDLAAQGNLMRTLEGLSALTGDSKYLAAVNECYQYYLDNYIAPEPNGLVYWGGHTAIDLISSAQLYAPNDMYTHELKGHGPYVKPFFELDRNKATNIVKSTWTTVIKDFSNMVFNRHQYYNKDIANFQSWENTGAYNSDEKGIISTLDGITFRAAANDYISMAYTLYDYTGDEKALTWAGRLALKYDGIRNKDTQLGGIVFTTPNGAPGVLDPMKVLEPIGKWWEADPMPGYYTDGIYGDRAQNQFADNFIDEGFITSDQRGDVLDPNMIIDGRDQYGESPYYDFTLAKKLAAYDSETANKIIDENIRSMAAYVRYGYYNEGGRNRFLPLLANGTSLYNFEIKRTGYYGNKGEKLGYANSYAQFFISYAMAYELAEGKAHLAEDRKTIWNLIRDMGAASAANGDDLGNLGNNFPGDNMSVNLETACTRPDTLIGMLILYKYTDRTEFLDLARRIGDNLITAKYRNGWFVDEGIPYARFDNKYSLALLKLDEAIRGLDVVPDYTTNLPFFNSDYIDPDGAEHEKLMDIYTIWRDKTLKYTKDYDSAFFENCYYDGFENDSGDFRDNWKYVDADTMDKFPNSRAEIAADPDGGNNNCVKVTKQTGDTSAFLYTDLTDTDGTNGIKGVVEVKTRIRSSKPNDVWHAVWVNQENNDSLVRVRFSRWGVHYTYQIYNTGSSSWQDQNVTINYPWTGDKWFELTILLDTNERVYDIYIDDEKVNSSPLPFYLQNPSSAVYGNDSAKMLAFYTDADNTAANTTFYIDDVSVARLNSNEEYIITDLDLYSGNNVKSTLSGSGGEVLNSFESFDNISVVPSGWKQMINTGDYNEATQTFGETVSLVDLNGDGNQSLRVNRVYTTNNGAKPNDPSGKAIVASLLSKDLMDKEGNYISLNGKIEISLKLQTNTDNNYFYFYPSWGKYDALVRLRFRNKQIVVETEAGYPDVTINGYIVPKNDWMPIKLLLDTNARTFDLYIDETKLNNDPLPFYYQDTNSTKYGRTSLSMLNFSSDRNNAEEGSSFYIDDVSVRLIEDDLGLKRIGSASVIKNTPANRNGLLVGAIYQGNQLLDVRMMQLKDKFDMFDFRKMDLDIDLNNIENYDFKCFIIDEMGNIKPISNVLQFSE